MPRILMEKYNMAWWGKLVEKYNIEGWGKMPGSLTEKYNMGGWGKPMRKCNIEGWGKGVEPHIMGPIKTVRLLSMIPDS